MGDEVGADGHEGEESAAEERSAEVIAFDGSAIAGGVGEGGFGEEHRGEAGHQEEQAGVDLDGGGVGGQVGGQEKAVDQDHVGRGVEKIGELGDEHEDAEGEEGEDDLWAGGDEEPLAATPIGCQGEAGEPDGERGDGEAERDASYIGVCLAGQLHEGEDGPADFAADEDEVVGGDAVFGLENRSLGFGENAEGVADAEEEDQAGELGGHRAGGDFVKPGEIQAISECQKERECGGDERERDAAGFGSAEVRVNQIGLIGVFGLGECVNHRGAQADRSVGE